MSTNVPTDLRVALDRVAEDERKMRDAHIAADIGRGERLAAALEPATNRHSSGLE